MSMQRAQYMLLFLVLMVNSDQFQILQSFSPRRMFFCALAVSDTFTRYIYEPLTDSSVMQTQMTKICSGIKQSLNIVLDETL